MPSPRTNRVAPPSTSCPNCNAVQRFAIKEREAGDLVELYVCCFMCKEEIPIATVPPEEAAQILRRQRRGNRGKI